MFSAPTPPLHPSTPPPSPASGCRCCAADASVNCASESFQKLLKLVRAKAQLGKINGAFQEEEYAPVSRKVEKRRHKHALSTHLSRPPNLAAVILLIAPSSNSLHRRCAANCAAGEIKKKKKGGQITAETAKGLVGLVQVVKMKTRLLQPGYRLPETFMLVPRGSCVRICERRRHYLLFHWRASQLYVPKVLRLSQRQFFFFSAYASCSDLSYNVPVA